MNTSYNAWIECMEISGDSRIDLLPEGICVDALFSQLAISYARIHRISFENYRVRIENEIQDMECSKMGQQCEWFYDALKNAYNQRILKAFGVSGSLDFETNGVCEYDGWQGRAVIRIYNDSICVLPPDVHGRRIPFLFINGMKREDYAVQIRLSSGEIYRFSMMGRDFEPFVQSVMTHVRSMKEKNIEFIQKLDESLGIMEVTKLSGVVSEGLLIPLDKLSKLSPSVSKAMISRIEHSKMNAAYAIMKQMCDNEKISMGAMSIPEEQLEEMLSKMEDATQLTDAQKEAMRWKLWMAVPSKDGTKAIVEFAFPMEATATYVFQIQTSWEHFLSELNRSMEASGWARELFTLSENELVLEKNDLSYMLIERTPSIQSLRRKYIGRIIHRSEEQWKKDLANYLR